MSYFKKNVQEGAWLLVVVNQNEGFSKCCFRGSEFMPTVISLL